MSLSLALVLRLACAAPPSDVDLAFDLETNTRALTPTWQLVLVDGKVYRRRAPSPAASRSPLASSAARSSWHLVPPDGVPAASARIEVIKELIVPIARAFEPPTRLVEIGADGDNLIVVDDRRRVYYAKLGADPGRVGAWADVWGPPGLAAPLALPDDTIAWAISQRAQPYEDIDGNVHPVSAGVTTLYGLFAPDAPSRGSRIGYQDPWLPPPAMSGGRWDREVCPPERGTLTLISLAASASTIAVMDDGGRVFTRLADFDTLGHNPALPYSWRREKRGGLEENIRSLPPEDWRLQPRIPGPHGAALTIFFTGAGNARRRLRVAAPGGFWEKDLLDPAWRLVTTAPRGARSDTPEPGGGPPLVLVEDREPTRHPPRGERLHTKIGKADVTVEDFGVQCPGAAVTVARDGERVSLTLWHSERLLEVDRRETDLRGALIIEGKPTGQLADDVRELFEGEAVHEVEVDVHERYVDVKSAAVDMKRMKRPLKVRLPRSRDD